MYFSNFSAGVIGVRSDGCHMREFDLCFATLAGLAKPSGVPRTEAELDHQCGFLVETEECIEDYVDDCMPEMMKLLADHVLNGTSQLREDFCTNGSKLRTGFIEHGDCLSIMMTESKPCIQDLNVAFELVTNNDTDASDRTGLMCCSVSRAKKCMKEIIAEKCGEGALNFLEEMKSPVMGRLASLICEEYPDEHEMCERLPPSGTPPAKRIRGKKMSILNRLLGAYTGF